MKPDRKISCDKTLPFCRNCSKNRKTCTGYGVRLSWGKPNDRRRHIVLVKSSATAVDVTGLAHFVNTRYEDTRVFYKYYDEKNYGKSKQDI